MTLTEVNELLEYIGEFHPITITVSKVQAWWDVIGHLDYEDARKALVQCLQESEFIPRPSQIVKRVPPAVEFTKLDHEEGEFFDDVYRKQTERNAAKRRTAGLLPERPDTIPSQ